MSNLERINIFVWFSFAWLAVSNLSAQDVNVSIGTLPSGARITFEVSVSVVDPVDAGVDFVSNQATLTGSNQGPVVTTDPGGTPNPGGDDATDTLIDAAPDLALTSISDGGANATPGGVINYSLAYANLGNQGASGVVLQETVPANSSSGSNPGWERDAVGSGLDCDAEAAGTNCFLIIGLVAGGGGSGSATFQLVLDNPVLAGVDSIFNCASVSDDGTNGTDQALGNNNNCDETPVSAEPDLNVTKDDSGVTGAPGQIVVYTITYDNVGNQGATGVVLTETVPSSSTFDAANSDPSWSPQGAGVYTLDIGAVSVGGGSTANFAVVVDDPVAAAITELNNCVTVADDAGNGVDPTPANNNACDTTPLNAAPDMTIQKTDAGVTAEPGMTVVYSLTIDNVGNQDATGAVITETVPSGSSFSSSASTVGWTPAGGGSYTFSVGALAVGGGSAVDFAVTVDTPATAGLELLDNCASLADDLTNGSDPTPGNNTACDQTPIDAAPDLSISKAYSGPVPFPGDDISFALSFSNLGSQGATGVTLTETVPVNTQSATSNPGWEVGSVGSGVPCTSQPTGTSCVLSIPGGVAGAGGSASANFDVTILDPLPGGMQIVNTACIDDDNSNGPDLDPANNCGEATVSLDLIPPQIVNVDSDADSGDGMVEPCEAVTTRVQRIMVAFDEPMFDGSGGPSDVSNINNWRLVSPALASDYDTFSCTSGPGADQVISIDSIDYDDTTFVATLNLNAGEPLPGALYRLIACGSTTLRDAAGNALDGNSDGTGGDDFFIDFRIDLGNRFDNAHFDCSDDFWFLGTTIPGAIGYEPTIDFEASPLSGSEVMLSLSPTGQAESFNLAQCIALPPERKTLMSARVRLDAPGGGFFGVETFCDIYSGSSCDETLLQQSNAALIVGDSLGSFFEVNDEFTSPSGAASAYCGLEIDAPFGDALEVHVDAMRLIDDPEFIFSDGFESGDTLIWSSSTP